MKARLPFAAFAALLLAACEAPPPAGPVAAPVAAGFEPIRSEMEFRSELVGRQVRYPDGAVGTYFANNIWRVTRGGTRIASGTWEWSGDRWCYEGTGPQGAVSGCDRVEVSLEAVRFIRDDGTAGTLPFIM